MTQKPEKITPKGKPQNLEELEKIARIYPKDLRQAIARANPELKEYLEAKASD